LRRDSNSRKYGFILEYDFIFGICGKGIDDERKQKRNKKEHCKNRDIFHSEKSQDKEESVDNTHKFEHIEDIIVFKNRVKTVYSKTKSIRTTRSLFTSIFYI